MRVKINNFFQISGYPIIIEDNKYKRNQVQLPEGSEYSGDLKSGLVWILNVQKEVGFQMVRILNGIGNPKAQPLIIQI